MRSPETATTDVHCPRTGWHELLGVLSTAASGYRPADAPATHPGGLLAALGQISDPRHRRGVRHPLAYVLALAIAAVACGETTIIAIADWAAGCARTNQKLLGALGARFNRRTRRYHAPHHDTFDRITWCI
jgi:hypothetical protein